MLDVPRETHLHLAGNIFYCLPPSWRRVVNDFAGSSGNPGRDGEAGAAGTAGIVTTGTGTFGVSTTGSGVGTLTADTGAGTETLGVSTAGAGSPYFRWASSRRLSATLTS